MTLTQIFIFAGLGLAAGSFYKQVNRGWLLFAASALAVFWLQPASLVRNLPFLLPAASLGLAATVWALTLPREYQATRQDRWAAGLLAGLMLLVSSARTLEPLSNLLAARPPGLEVAASVALVILALAVLAYRLGRGRGLALGGAVLVLIAFLVILKSPPLAAGASAFLRTITGQDPALASSIDIGWLGFSYIAFRLIHSLRDRVSGRLPQVSLRDFVTYIVFFPALTAGPIDRVERFQTQLHPEFFLGNEQLLAAGRRLALGLFFKFVLADGLAFFSLSGVNAWQVQGAGWAWVLLLAYAFRIFFDFAGYTHIAIGLGLLFGVLLPENFDRPYLKPNLTAFWNSWHISLALWFRAYYFNPPTRWLRTRQVQVWLIILIGQLSTMALIGLWHGITWNFLAWGLWHGAGLFVHSLFVQLSKARQLSVTPRLSQPLGVAATFIFVTLGWVWFALPAPQDAGRVFGLLFGMQ
jgi:D-alanyl-lipoteichoic acid acyltransferase DltB (MBOAT superfamily)